jgi:hypothetical protein
MSSHEYWDINFTANNGDAGYVGGVEVEMMVALGGVDQCSGGSAIGSSGYYGLGNAFDDNNTTIFAQDFGGGTARIGYHFASAVDIIQFSITCENTGFTNRAPKDFTLRSSDDGSTWTVVKTVTGEVSWTPLERRVFSAIAGYIAGDVIESLSVTNWRVTATSIVDGAFNGTILTGEGGTTYNIPCPAAVPSTIHIEPKIDGIWAANDVVALDEYRIPTDLTVDPILVKATAIGSAPHETDATEPTWTGGGPWTDNDITWTKIIDLDDGLFQTLGPRVPS